MQMNTTNTTQGWYCYDAVYKSKALTLVKQSKILFGHKADTEGS